MKPRVLLVEDNVSIVRLVTDLLTVNGYDVVSTCVADEVTRTVEETPPDLVLMDVNLPGETDGLTLTRHIKSRTPAPPVIVFTASAMAEDRARAREAGCDAFLAKPVRMSDLMATVHAHAPSTPGLAPANDELRPEGGTHPFGEQPGPAPVDPTAPLREGLKSPSGDARAQAVTGLEQAALDDGEALAALQACVRTPGHPARWRALRSLVRVAGASADARQVVRALAAEADNADRVVMTLGLPAALRDNLEEGMALLVTLVAGADASVQDSAAQAVVEAAAALPQGPGGVVEELAAHPGSLGVLPALAAEGGACSVLADALLDLARADDDSLPRAMAAWRASVGDAPPYGVLERLTRVSTMDEVLVAAADIGLALAQARRGLQPALEELRACIERLATFETETDPERQSAIVQHAVEELERWKGRRLAEGSPFAATLSCIATRCRAVVVSTLLSARSGATLTLRVKARHVVPGSASHVTLEVRNQGPGVAYGVVVEMAAGQSTLMQVGSHQLSAIGPGDSPCVDFVFVPAAGSLQASFSARYADFSQAEGLATCVEDLASETSSFRTIPNPYIPGLPLELGSELFLGREDIFRFVAENLFGSRRMVVLTGQRRMGKTSLLKQLPLRLPSSAVPVFVDCQGLEHRGLGNMLSHLSYIIAEVLREEGIEVPIPDVAGFNERPVFSFECEFLKPATAALGNRTLLLLIDEFQALDEAVEAGELLPGHLGVLRSLMQHQDRLGFLFSGLQKPLEQARDYWQPVFNVALRREVGLLEEACARELIEKPTAGFVQFHAGAVDEIIRLACGHPYLTQLFCDRLVSRQNDRRDNVVRVQQVHEVIAEVFSAGVNHFFSLWDDLNGREKIVLIALSATLSHHQFATLSAVTRYLRERGISADLDELTTVLQQLLGHNLIRYGNSQPPGYCFSVQLFRLWIEKQMLHALIGTGLKWS